MSSPSARAAFPAFYQVKNARSMSKGVCTILTDWITAVSTFGTMLVAGIAAWASLAMYWRAVSREMPIIEPDFTWKVDPQLGRCIHATLKIVNRLDETLTIISAAVAKPRAASVSMGEYRTDRSGYQSHFPTASSKRDIPLGWDVQPRGAFSQHFGARDITRRDLYIFPPESWRGGIVRITLTASTKALTIRDRRITIKRRLHAMTNNEKADNASKTA